jgi:hypothetical protein
MQLLLLRQMALNKEAMTYLYGQFQEFSMQHRRVRVAKCANAIPNPLMVCLPLCDYSDGKLTQRFPNYALPRDFEELRDQSKLQALNNKHNVRHLGQILLCEKVEQSDDKEYEQIYLI